MGKSTFFSTLQRELERIDAAKLSKRREKVIEGFTPDKKAIIAGKPYLVFNSNDYLGLRFHPAVAKGEEEATKKYGAGPGAVRFISGTTQVHRELEKALAAFHGREDAMLFSSAFTANMAVLHCIIKGQNKDSIVGDETLVISDEYNHRSIIDGIRVAQVPKNRKLLFKHLRLDELDNILAQNAGKFKRVLLVTDGLFSMLGDYQDLGKMQQIVKKNDASYEEGIIIVLDDSHGVACFGATGRGCEEASKGKADLLLGTLGKGFGTDGGYVTGSAVLINYLRESAATYIFSNPMSPGTAGAALASLKIVQGDEGRKLRDKLQHNVQLLKKSMLEAGFKFTVDSTHAIQALLIADTEKTRALTQALFEAGILVTPINYPIVPKGMEEIRIQLSALHTDADIDFFVKTCTRLGKLTKVI